MSPHNSTRMYHTPRQLAKELRKQRLSLCLPQRNTASLTAVQIIIVLWCLQDTSRYARELLARLQPVVNKTSNCFALVAFTLEHAFPDNSYPPSTIEQRINVPSVSGNVFVKLLAPEIHVGSGRRGRLATVAVPETAMDEQSRLEPGEDDIRRSRQPLVVKPISQPDFVQRPSKLHLRTGVLLTDPGHDSRTCRFVHCIHCRSSSVTAAHILSTILSSLSSCLLFFRNSEYASCAPLMRES